ncbi:MAG TPA: hypothetical protein VKZ53_17370 [Candidatus Angelobacter sp.]|nr:hypothetical protein [Candidatus Angelobacter sp.]
MPKVERHFDISEWSDYVREQGSSEQRSEMLSHLESGCLKCQKTSDLLKKFMRVCTRETTLDFPEGLERPIRAYFALHKRERIPTLKQILASLIYDSLNAPQPVGVRSGHQISRHVLFEAGDYSVDLRFEHEKGSANMVLVGQIANKKEPEELLADMPVILVAGSREVTRSLSNSFGEFQMEYTPQADLHLRVPLEAKGQELEVVLDSRGND